MAENGNTSNDLQIKVPDFEKLFTLDPNLRAHELEIRRRYDEFQKLLINIHKAEGMLK
mgnify:CR=1 FL=1